MMHGQPSYLPESSASNSVVCPVARSRGTAWPSPECPLGGGAEFRRSHVRLFSGTCNAGIIYSTRLHHILQLPPRRVGRADALFVQYFIVIVAVERRVAGHAILNAHGEQDVEQPLQNRALYEQADDIATASCNQRPSIMIAHCVASWS